MEEVSSKTFRKRKKGLKNSREEISEHELHGEDRIEKKAFRLVTNNYLATGRL